MLDSSCTLRPVCTTVGTQKSPTPILDRLEPLPPSVGMSPVRILIEIVLGVSFYAVLVVVMLRPPPFVQSFLHWVGKNLAAIFVDEWAGVRLILTGFSMALAGLAAIAVHECGHLVAGLIGGLRFRSLRFGRVMVKRPLRISRYRGPQTVALGHAFMTPTNGNGLRSRYAAMLLAGPLANLLWAYVIFTLPFKLTLTSGFFVVFSSYLGIVSLIPFTWPSVTDGMRLIELCWDRRRGDRWLAIVRLSAQLDDGVTPEALARVDIDEAIALCDSSSETVRAHLIAHLATRSKDDAEAARLLETSLKYSGYAESALRELLAIYAAVFQANKRCRIDLAEQWLADTPDNSQFQELRAKLQAAILKAKNGKKGPSTPHSPKALE
jgi:hypothetical protein